MSATNETFGESVSVPLWVMSPSIRTYQTIITQLFIISRGHKQKSSCHTLMAAHSCVRFVNISGFSKRELLFFLQEKKGAIEEQVVCVCMRVKNKFARKRSSTAQSNKWL